MKKYKVIITTTFVQELEIEAKSAGEAQRSAEEYLDGALDSEPSTTIKAKLIKQEENQNGQT